jgi:hypothetical protein
MSLSIQRSNNFLVDQPVYAGERNNRVNTLQDALRQLKEAETPTVKEKLIAFFKNIALTLALGGAILLHRYENAMPAFLKKVITSLVDSALPHWIEEESFSFTFRHYPGAQAETPGPVAADQLFYQQKQYQYFCAIHSLCHFAGYKINNIIGALAQTSNDFWCNLFQNKQTSKEQALEAVKKVNLYTDSVSAINRNGGFGIPVVKDFIRSHKEIFHLPEACTIQGGYGVFDSEEIQTALQEIEADPHRHRIIVSMTGEDYGHFVTIRKDKAGLWRIVDSMAEESGEISKVQPSFSTLREAVEVSLHNHKAKESGVSLIYPSEDNDSL